MPEDYLSTVKDTLKAFDGSAYQASAQEIAKEGWVTPNKRIFNNAKISDHFAIIPTGQIPSGLDEAERKLYDMVCRRFVSVFYPAAEFEVTKRITRIDQDSFRSDGKVLKIPGWLEVYKSGTVRCLEVWDCSTSGSLRRPGV